MEDVLNYYREHNIIPVHQSLPQGDADTFEFQREVLYSELGLFPGSVFDKAVLEFGPGTGNNAKSLLSWKPRQLLLVGGNPASLKSLNEVMSKKDLDGVCTVRNGDLMDFTDPSLIPGTTSVEGNFDVVICEGVINGQTDPRSAVKHVASFVKPGGMFC